MSKKKGLSMDEKVLKVEEYFKENQVPFTIKELESNIPKAKGVLFQSVQECVAQLVAENRVQSEKIGVFNLFWLFEATVGNNLVAKTTDMEAGAQRCSARNDAMRATLAALEAQHTASTDEQAERIQLQQQYAALCDERRTLEEQLAEVSDFDPTLYNELCTAAVMCRDAANRWTDYVLVLERTAARRAGISRDEFRRRFCIPDDFDFIEEADVPPFT